MPELLLELFSEEIPARMQERAAAQLADSLYELVQAMGFGGAVKRKDVEAFATPRRLAAVVRNMPAEQPDEESEQKGPAVDAPDNALAGFLRSLGIPRDHAGELVPVVRRLETGKSHAQRLSRDCSGEVVVSRAALAKGDFFVAVVKRRGRPTPDVLAERLPELIRAFAWPKSMRWGARSLRWVRPLSSILCLFGGRVVPFTLDEGIVSGNTTRGHRFLAPEPFEVRDFADYEAKLRQARVVLHSKERCRIIREGAERLVEERGLRLAPDPGLVAENAGMVEWPVVLLGSFDPAFMTLPPEVLTSAMRSHQKYFAVQERDGSLSNHFVVVANMEAANGGMHILAGNERVLRARLADAKFFWEKDRHKHLADRVDALTGVMFHARLGTLGRKVQRLRRLAPLVAKSVPGADLKAVERAALLCKADLTSEMVGEFPELQGIMGRYYALEGGEPPAVAAAIGAHYAPQGPGDVCPSAPESVALALADKIDTLVGFFAIGEKPTGSKDPFALRRAALGVIRLLIENELRLPLRPVFAAAYAAYGDRLPQPSEKGGAGPEEVESVFDELLVFFADRLKAHLREKGVRHDLVSAVFARGGEDDLVRLLAKVAALDTFLKTEDGANLLIAYRRGANILRIEEKRDGVRYDKTPDPGRFRQREEEALFERLGTVGARAAGALAQEDFTAAMAELATLRGPVDAFFDRVTVNCEDAELRRNRLYLLSRVRAELDAVADFSKIEG